MSLAFIGLVVDMTAKSILPWGWQVVICVL
jgi:hypothetical protein